MRSMGVNACNVIHSYRDVNNLDDSLIMIDAYILEHVHSQKKQVLMRDFLKICLMSLGLYIITVVISLRGNCTGQLRDLI